MDNHLSNQNNLEEPNSGNIDKTLKGYVETITPEFTYHQIYTIVQHARGIDNGFEQLHQLRSSLVIHAAKLDEHLIDLDKESILYKYLVRAAQAIDYPNLSPDDAFSQELKQRGLELQKYFFSVESVIKLKESYTTFESLLNTSYGKISGYHKFYDDHLPLLFYFSNAAHTSDLKKFNELRMHFTGTDLEFMVELIRVAKTADWYIINFPEERQKFPKGKVEQAVDKYLSNLGRQSSLNN